MSYLFSMALVLFLLAPQDQRLPDAFHRLPAHVSEQATVIVTGTYGHGRSPCIFMPDGSRRWYRESWFRIKKVYRGQAGGKYIYFNSMLPPRDERPRVDLEVDREYLLLLRPNEESLKAIKAGDYVPTWSALHDEEIIAIVELK